MWDVWDVGCSECGIFEMWNLQDVDVWSVECLVCGMFGMCDVRGVRCSKCETFGMWDVWDMRSPGYVMSGMWNVQDLGCWDAGCLGCGMFGISNVACGLFTGMWDAVLQNFVYSFFRVFWDNFN